jgi:hypothetical protein
MPLLRKCETWHGLRVVKLNQNLDELTAKLLVGISALLERLRSNIS